MKLFAVSPSLSKQTVCQGSNHISSELEFGQSGRCSVRRVRVVDLVLSRVGGQFTVSRLVINDRWSHEERGRTEAMTSEADRDELMHPSPRAANASCLCDWRGALNAQLSEARGLFRHARLSNAHTQSRAETQHATDRATTVPGSAGARGASRRAGFSVMNTTSSSQLVHLQLST